MEILDSRGRPTVQALVRLSGGMDVLASVPSGASTGAAEALELRDGDQKRYGGLGCRKAVANVNGEIATELVGEEWTQQSLDRAMIELDGTPNKSRLGANAILAVSIAFARAAAASQGVPLYHHFDPLSKKLPRLTINLFSGGIHGGGQVPIQDVLIVPLAPTIEQGLADAYAVYYASAKLIGEKYKMRLLRADEGGLAPPSSSIDAMFDDAVESIRRAGLQPGGDIAIAVDVASSHFYRDGRYQVLGQSLDSAGMIRTIESWVKNWPIISVEDGLSEDDWANWPTLRHSIGDKALVIGDDFLCTNPKRIERAARAKAASALLLKVNQIGTLTEAAEARKLASQAGWQVTVSARSGETEDNWLADLAVAWGDQIKVGSITQSERLAKYNRLLTIEAETGWPIAPWPR